MAASLFSSIICAVCFGDPGSPLSKGVVAGVLFLSSVIFFVLSCIAGTALLWARRARQLGVSER